MLHVAPGMQRPIEGIKEVLNCRLELEERFDRIIRGMAYPDTGVIYFENGADYETVKKYLCDLGIVYARTLGGDNDKFRMPTDWYKWMPTAHHKNPEIMNYIDKFLSIDTSAGWCSIRNPICGDMPLNLTMIIIGICLIEYAKNLAVTMIYGMLRILKFMSIQMLTIH